MSDYVVHMTKVVAGSTVASGRIATYISAILDLPLIDTREKAVEVRSVDKLIIVNGPMAFCDFLPELARLVEIADQVVWAQNDYTIKPPKNTGEATSPFRKIFVEKSLVPTYWTTIPDNVVTPEDAYVNWNALTWNPLRSVTPHIYNGLFYYGAFRENRLPSFNRYLNSTSYDVTVSTTGQRAKKFKGVAPNASIIAPNGALINTISQYQASIYIEDSKSHDQFHSLANRWGECASAGRCLLIDEESADTFWKANVPLSMDWIVSDSASVAKRLLSSEIIARDQLQAWVPIGDEQRKQLDLQVKEAYYKL